MILCPQTQEKSENPSPVSGTWPVCCTGGDCSVKISSLWRATDQQKLYDLTLTSPGATERRWLQRSSSKGTSAILEISDQVFSGIQRDIQCCCHTMHPCKPKPLQSPDENAGHSTPGQRAQVSTMWWPSDPRPAPSWPQTGRGRHARLMRRTVFSLLTALKPRNYSGKWQ